MPKRRRKLSPELEKHISLAKKQIELITAIIHDIDEEDIQEEYKAAFLPVMGRLLAKLIPLLEGKTPKTLPTYDIDGDKSKGKNI